MRESEGFLYLGEVLNRKRWIVLGRETLNKVYSSKTIVLILLRVNFLSLVGNPPDIGDVAPN